MLTDWLLWKMLLVGRVYSISCSITLQGENVTQALWHKHFNISNLWSICFCHGGSKNCSNKLVALNVSAQKYLYWIDDINLPL